MGPRLLAAGLVAAWAIGCGGAEGEPVGSTREAILDGTVSTSADDAVVLLATADDGRVVPKCTATLVAKNLIVTARHCVGRYDEDERTVADGDADDLLVYFGADAPLLAANRGRPAARGKQLFTTGGAKLVPDVAFVLLDREVNGPIASLRLDAGPDAGEALRAIGFGVNRDGPVKKRLARDVAVATIGPAKVPYDTLAAGEFDVGEALCAGDSGGPALAASGALVGVASRVGNGTRKDPDDATSFCTGDATDVYGTLAEVPDLVTEAFAAAGTSPRLEVRTHAAEGAPLDEPAPSYAAGGCSTTPAGTGRGGALVALALAALAVRRRAGARSTR